MRVLLDTHVFLWFFEGNDRLASSHRSLIVDPAITKVFSIVSAWEVSIKRRIGKLTLPLSYEDFFYKLSSDYGFEQLPITLEHLAVLDVLPLLHNDPFDRLLIAQAISEGIPFLTSDDTLYQYNVPIIK